MAESQNSTNLTVTLDDAEGVRVTTLESPVGPFMVARLTLAPMSTSLHFRTPAVARELAQRLLAGADALEARQHLLPAEVLNP